METVQVTPFLKIAATVAVSANASSQATALTAPANPKNPEQPGTVRVYNAGADLVFFNFSIGTGTATTADIPIPSGNTEVFWCPAGCTHVNVIASSATATVYFTPGQGS
jgi:hypothetical protein